MAAAKAMLKVNGHMHKWSDYVRTNQRICPILTIGRNLYGASLLSENPTSRYDCARSGTDRPRKSGTTVCSNTFKCASHGAVLRTERTKGVRSTLRLGRFERAECSLSEHGKSHVGSVIDRQWSIRRHMRWTGLIQVKDEKDRRCLAKTVI